VVGKEEVVAVVVVSSVVDSVVVVNVVDEVDVVGAKVVWFAFSIITVHSLSNSLHTFVSSLRISSFSS
jgi:hypothetical protein